MQSNSDSNFPSGSPLDALRRAARRSRTRHRKSFTASLAGILRTGRSKTSARRDQVLQMAFTPMVQKCPEPNYAIGIVTCPTSPSLRELDGTEPSVLVNVLKRGLVSGRHAHLSMCD
jgi:hypothetical protein